MRRWWISTIALAQVQVPHDWAIALPFAPPKPPQSKETEDAAAAHGYKAIGRDYPANSIGWYRTSIEVTAADQASRLWLEFDGVFRDSMVFVNGYIVAHNQSGYAPFRVEIDDFLNYDDKPNVIALRTDASLGEGWFYEGAGIYRHVDLVRADPLHIPQWGTFVRSEVGPDGDRSLQQRRCTSFRNFAPERFRRRARSPRAAPADVPAGGWGAHDV